MVFVNERRIQRRAIVCKPMWIVVLLGICLLTATSTIRARIELSHDGLTTQTIFLPRRRLVKPKLSSKAALNEARGLRTNALPKKQVETTPVNQVKTAPVKQVKTTPAKTAPAKQMKTTLVTLAKEVMANPVKRGKTNPVKQKLDFIIAGFPKCGTTTLLYALKAHKETDIASSERCDVANMGLSDDQAFEVLNDSAAELSPSPRVKRGIKCPTILRSYKTIARIEQHSPSAKFVVGLRHPIEMLESFYNYRVTEIYDHKLQEPIPSLNDVILRSKPWKGISRDTPRFDRNLMQFGKTHMSKADLQHFVGQKNMAVRPSEAKIFLYTLDQLNESSELSKPFRQDLQTFLDLEKPLQPMGHENLNNFVGKKAHPETVDICEEKYIDLRKKMIARGKQMASWIRDEFMQSPDVTVGNAKQFLKSLDSWSVDPCALRGSSAQPIVYVRHAKRSKQVV
jgi:hypothetical protein